MSKVTRKRLRELAMIDATATRDEVRSLVLEVKGARAMIERFAVLHAAAPIPAQQSICGCAHTRAAPVDSSVHSPSLTLN